MTNKKVLQVLFGGYIKHLPPEQFQWLYTHDPKIKTMRKLLFMGRTSVELCRFFKENNKDQIKRKIPECIYRYIPTMHLIAHNSCTKPELRAFGLVHRGQLHAYIQLVGAVPKLLAPRCFYHLNGQSCLAKLLSAQLL